VATIIVIWLAGFVLTKCKLWREGDEIGIFVDYCLLEEPVHQVTWHHKLQQLSRFHSYYCENPNCSDIIAREINMGI